MLESNSLWHLNIWHSLLRLIFLEETLLGCWQETLILGVMQVDCDIVKIDVQCPVRGDVVMECINVDHETEREEMMFRIMFNTAFIRSNILMLTRDDIDIMWNAKERYPKDFRAEVKLFSFVEISCSMHCCIYLPLIVLLSFLHVQNISGCLNFM